MSPSAADGFTLLEVSVVLVLMGLLALLTGPSLLTAWRGDPASAAADRVREVLLSARHVSAASGRPVRVTPVRGGRALLVGDSTVSLPPGARVRGSRLSPGARATAVFYPTGMSSGSRWWLDTDEEEPLRVSLDPLTGAVTISGSHLRGRRAPGADGRGRP